MSKTSLWWVAVFMVCLLLIGCADTPTQPGDPELSEFEAFSESELTSEDIGSMRLGKGHGLIKKPGTPFPFWARTSSVPPGIHATDEWGIIYFYVDPAVIPKDFNLLAFFDPRALAAEFVVEGYGWYQPDNATPYITKLKGKGAVPFWIITAEQATQVAEDGIITVAELESANPLRGSAKKFFEILKPFPGGAPVNGINTVASGRLEDGQRFLFHLQNRFVGGAGPGEKKVVFKLK